MQVCSLFQCSIIILIWFNKASISNEAIPRCMDYRNPKNMDSCFISNGQYYSWINPYHIVRYGVKLKSFTAESFSDCAQNCLDLMNCSLFSFFIPNCSLFTKPSESESNISQEHLTEDNRYNWFHLMCCQYLTSPHTTGQRHRRQITKRENDYVVYLEGKINQRGGRDVAFEDDFKDPKLPKFKTLSDSVCESVKKAGDKEKLVVLRCSINSIRQVQNVNSHASMTATIRKTDKGDAEISLAKAMTDLQKGIRELAALKTEANYLDQAAIVSNFKFSSVQIAGFVQSIGRKDTPWSTDYEDLNKVKTKELNKLLCESILESATKGGVFVKNCNVKSLFLSGVKTFAVVHLDLDRVKVDGTIETPAAIVAEMKKQIDATADTALAPFFLAKSSSVSDEISFKATEVVVTSLDSKRQDVEWLSKPRDCTFLYTLDFRKTGSENIQSVDLGCQNRHTNTGLEPDTDYEYRVIAKSTVTDLPLATSGWTKPVKTIAIGQVTGTSLTLDGIVHTVARKVVPFRDSYNNPKSQVTITMKKNICDSIRSASAEQKMRIFSCNIMRFEKLPEGSLAAHITAVVGPVGTDGNPVSRAEALTRMKAGIVKTAREGRRIAHLGEKCIISSFTGNEFSLNEFTETTQTVSWPGGPTDCSYRYVVQYQKEGSEKTLIKDAECKNKITITDLEPGSKYKYRLLSYRQGTTKPIISPWSGYKEKKIIPACGAWCIVGIVFGVIALIILLLVFAYFMWKVIKHVRENEAKNNEASNVPYNRSVTQANPDGDYILRDSWREDPNRGPGGGMVNTAFN